MFRLVPVLLFGALLAACGGGGPSGSPDAGPDAGPYVQGSPPTGELVVNEVAPRPALGEDWLELENRSDGDLDLCDYFVTDSLDRLDHYLPLAGVAPPDPCSPRILEPGGLLVVYADDLAAEGLDHAPFKLGEADEVHVVTATGIQVDSFLYLYPATGSGRSLARIPDGEGLFYVVEGTPGAPNPEAL